MVKIRHIDELIHFFFFIDTDMARGNQLLPTNQHTHTQKNSTSELLVYNITAH